MIFEYTLYNTFFPLTVEEHETKKKKKKETKKKKKRKGNLTRFKIIDIYDDIPCVCRKFTTQIK